MNAQEQQLIDDLVNRIRSTDLQNKDEAAEQRLQQGLANSPDAIYILAQTVIVQKYGLEQAQQRLQDMQTELDSLREQATHSQAPKPSGGSFLSNLFGGSSTTPPAPAPPQPGGWQPVTNPGYPQAGYAPAPSGYPPPGYGYGQPSGWGGSPMGGGGGFLHNALQTAAGVAMGEMAVQSVESLFHGFGGGGGYGRGFEGGGPSETIINNYEDGGSSRRERDDDRDRVDDSSFYNPHHDASRDSDTHAFADADADADRGNRDDSNDDDSNNDDTGSDDTGFDSGSDSSDDSSNFSGDDGN